MGEGAVRHLSGVATRAKGSFLTPALASAFVRAGMGMSFHSSASVERKPRDDSGFGTSVAPGTEVPPEGVMALNNLRDNKGSVKKAR